MPGSTLSGTRISTRSNVDTFIARGGHSAFRRLGGATSDHAIRHIEADGVRAVTWNMMDKCRPIDMALGEDGQPRRPFTNNPMDIAETLSQYHVRKEEQFEQLVKMLEQQAAAGQPLDCVFLQEVDWARMWNWSGNAADEAALGTTDQAQLALCRDFRTELTRLGWNAVLADDVDPTTAASDGAVEGSQQRLLTLYNINTLTLAPSSEGVPIGKSVLPTADRQQSRDDGTLVTTRRYRGYAVEFNHRRQAASAAMQQVAVTLCNLHLDYDTDHKADLEALMTAAVSNDRVFIAGGDTNHPPGTERDYPAIGEEGCATAVDRHGQHTPATATTASADTLTTAHRGTERSKCYDTFFVAGPGSVDVREMPTEHFVVTGRGNNTVALLRPDPPQVRVSRTPAAQAWTRTCLASATTVPLIAPAVSVPVQYNLASSVANTRIQQFCQQRNASPSISGETWEVDATAPAGQTRVVVKRNAQTFNTLTAQGNIVTPTAAENNPLTLEHFQQAVAVAKEGSGQQHIAISLLAVDRFPAGLEKAVTQALIQEGVYIHHANPDILTQLTAEAQANATLAASGAHTDFARLNQTNRQHAVAARTSSSAANGSLLGTASTQHGDEPASFEVVVDNDASTDTAALT